MSPKIESKSETSKVKRKTNWKPLLKELSVLALRGVISGMAMQTGIMVFNKSFGRTNNLLLINGGKKSISA
jgi:hypothetical protein